MYLKIFHKNLFTARCCETSSFFYGIAEGFASASPDYETTSQQDNEWDFASPDYETTSQQDYKWDFASQTSDKSHETKETLAL